MSSRLVALDLYLRLREKPRLARATSVAAARARMERVTRLVPLPRGLAVGEGRLGGRPALRIAPPPGGGLLLWLHGGAYCLGSHRTHAPLVAALALRAGVGAALPDYRLAPEHAFPAAFEDARAAWDALVAEGWPPRRIALGGDSAGGGLAFALLAGPARRGRRPGGARRLQPVDRPDALGREPPAARPARRAAAGAAAARGARPLPRRRRPRRPARLAAPRRLSRRRRRC